MFPPPEAGLRFGESDEGVKLQQAFAPLCRSLSCSGGPSRTRAAPSSGSATSSQPDQLLSVSARESNSLVNVTLVRRPRPGRRSGQPTYRLDSQRPKRLGCFGTVTTLPKRRSQRSAHRTSSQCDTLSTCASRSCRWPAGAGRRAQVPPAETPSGRSIESCVGYREVGHEA